MASRNVKRINTALASTSKPLKEVSAAVIGDSGLENVIAGMGTDRDKRSYSRYSIPRILTMFELQNMFRVSWLAKRIVNVVAEDMTRAWRTFIFDDADNNPQKDALVEAEKDFQLQTKFREAISWARLYGGSCIVIGTSDAVNTSDLATPLRVESVKKGGLKYLQVLDRWRIAPSGTLTTDLSSPNFGLPDSYIVAESSVVVHHTRILRFNGQKLPYFSWLANGMWDDSELQHVLDSLTNYDTTTSAISSMMFEANIDVVQTEGLTELLSTQAGERKLLKRFQLGAMMKSFNRMLVLDSTEKYEKKQNSFTNLDKVWEQYMVDCCGAANIPMVKLFGQSPGGLNATTDDDTRNYLSRINADQETGLRPQLEYFDEIFVRSTLGNIPKGYKFQFESLWQMDDADEATIGYQNAQRDQIYLSAGVVSEGLVASELKANGVYRTMSDEDVELAVELGKTMDDYQETQRDNQQAATDPANNKPASGVGQNGQDPDDDAKDSDKGTKNGVA